jgi:hypothetical protein
MSQLFAADAAIRENKTADKIWNFSNLKRGWRYGEGLDFDSSTISNAIQLLESGIGAGFQRTDAFPGRDGDITVALYRGKSRYGFNVEQQGTVSFLHESGTDEIACEEELSMDEALKKIETLGLWNLYFYCTSPNTMQIVVGSLAIHSRNQAGSTEVESPWSTGIARWLKVIQSAPISGDFTQALPKSRRSFGFSTPQYCGEQI